MRFCRSWCSSSVRWSWERIQPHYERGLGQPGANPDRHGRAEAQIDVVPEHRRVGLVVDEEAGRMDRVAMTLDDLHSGLMGNARQGVGQLADAAADRWDHAAAPELPPGDIALAQARTSCGQPEAEGLPRLQNDSVDGTRGNPEVLHLAELGVSFAWIGAGVKPMLVGNDQRRAWR